MPLHRLRRDIVALLISFPLHSFNNPFASYLWYVYVQIRFDRLKELLSNHGGFGAVIAFKPTGWTLKANAANPTPAPSHPHMHGTATASHHATASTSTTITPLMAMHAPRRPASLQPVGNMHVACLERSGGAAAQQMHADNTGGFESCKHARTACHGHTEQLTVAEDGDDPSGMVTLTMIHMNTVTSPLTIVRALSRIFEPYSILFHNNTCHSDGCAQCMKLKKKKLSLCRFSQCSSMGETRRSAH